MSLSRKHGEPYQACLDSLKDGVANINPFRRCVVMIFVFINGIDGRTIALSECTFEYILFIFIGTISVFRSFNPCMLAIF